MASLFNISDRLRAAYEMAQTGEHDDDIIQNTIESIEFELEDKADNYAYLIDEIKGKSNTIKAEMDRLSAMKRVNENFAARLKANLEQAMISAGNRKFKTETRSYAIQANPPRVAIDDIDAVLAIEGYRKEIIWDESMVDKAKLKDDLKAGVEVAGARLASGESLRIR